MSCLQQTILLCETKFALKSIGLSDSLLRVTLLAGPWGITVTNHICKHIYLSDILSHWEYLSFYPKATATDPHSLQLTRRNQNAQRYVHDQTIQSLILLRKDNTIFRRGGEAGRTSAAPSSSPLYSWGCAEGGRI